MYARNTGSVLLRVGKDIYISRERGREDVSINTGNIEALALSGDKPNGPLSLPVLWYENI